MPLIIVVPASLEVYEPRTSSRLEPQCRWQPQKTMSWRMKKRDPVTKLPVLSRRLNSLSKLLSQIYSFVQVPQPYDFVVVQELRWNFPKMIGDLNSVFGSQHPDKRVTVVGYP